MGLKVGTGDPVGEAYADFQHAIRALTRRGVLLAIASKNNPEDVDSVFQQRSDMPLRREDFSVVQISWNSKVQALETIANTLEIGIDSLVFMDDNPAERAMVRGALPQVLVPELPDSPALYANFLRRQGWFERLQITTEDHGKTRQYRDQAERAAVRRASGSLDQYLVDLGTELEVRRAGPKDLPRIHQLFNKTNQFNLTTRRYGLGEVEEFAGSPRHLLCVASARDRYGELGQIGVFLVDVDGKDATLDSFLVSCRALGRGIESAMMNALKQTMRRLLPDGVLIARFMPTPKNAPARGFLEAQGLRLVDVGPGGEMAFRTPIADLQPIDTPHIGVQCRPPT